MTLAWTHDSDKKTYPDLNLGRYQSKKRKAMLTSSKPPIKKRIVWSNMAKAPMMLIMANHWKDTLAINSRLMPPKVTTDMTMTKMPDQRSAMWASMQIAPSDPAPTASHELM